ncbi:MAG: KH domain-containing protein [Anaerolineae bacterium]
MKELIEYMAQSLVDNPEAVYVEESMGVHSAVYKLHVAPEDRGRVIGKGGRIANAMRILLRVAGTRQGKHVVLEIE